LSVRINFALGLKLTLFFTGIKTVPGSLRQRRTTNYSVRVRGSVKEENVLRPVCAEGVSNSHSHFFLLEIVTGSLRQRRTTNYSVRV
jgi:hypothetical protein